MAYPGYQPLAIPQQPQQGASSLSPQQLMQLMQYLNKTQGAQSPQMVAGQPTYQQVLASMGQQQQPQQQSGGLDFNNILKSLGEDKAKSAATTAVTSAAPEAGASLLPSGSLGTGIPGLEGGSAMVGGGQIGTAGIGIPGLEGGVPLSGGAIAPAGTVAGPWSLSGFGSAGNFYAPAAGALLAYDVLNSRRGGWGGAAEGALSGAGIGSYFGPWGAGIGALIGGGVGYFDKHKPTAQYESERWKGTLDKFKGDPNQAAVNNLYLAAHPKGDTGKGWTPEVAANALKDPIAMWGQQGMLDTFGSDYFNSMNEAQRYAASKTAIDNGLLKADHGDVIVTDPEKLKSLAEQNYNNQNYTSAYNNWKNGTSGATNSSSTPNPVMIPRTGRKGAGYGTSNYQR